MNKCLLASVMISGVLCVLGIPEGLAGQRYQISLQTFSLNSELDSLDKIMMGYRFEFIYHFNKSFYTKNDVTFYHHNRFGFSSKLGYQLHYFKYFVPYAEMGFDNKPLGDSSRYRYAYDVGVNYLMTRHFTPSLEIDNFTTPNQESAKLGLQYAFNSTYSFKVDFIHSLVNQGDGFDLKFNIGFD